MLMLWAINMLSHHLCAFVNPACETIPSTQRAIHSSGSWPLRRTGQWNMHGKAPHLSLLKCFAFLPQSVKDWCRQRSAAHSFEPLEGARSFSYHGLPSSRLNPGLAHESAAPRMSRVASPQKEKGSSWSNASLTAPTNVSFHVRLKGQFDRTHTRVFSVWCGWCCCKCYEAVMYVTTARGTQGFRQQQVHTWPAQKTLTRKTQPGLVLLI